MIDPRSVLEVKKSNLFGWLRIAFGKYTILSVSESLKEDAEHKLACINKVVVNELPQMFVDGFPSVAVNSDRIGDAPVHGGLNRSTIGRRPFDFRELAQQCANQSAVRLHGMLSRVAAFVRG